MADRTEREQRGSYVGGITTWESLIVERDAARAEADTLRDDLETETSLRRMAFAETQKAEVALAAAEKERDTYRAALKRVRDETTSNKIHAIAEKALAAGAGE